MGPHWRVSPRLYQLLGATLGGFPFLRRASNASCADGGTATAPNPGGKNMSARWVLVALTGTIAVLSGTQALGQQACKPTMMFIEVRYSAMQLPKLHRTWTAVLSVDASQCQTLSGRFEIVYSMEKETAPDYEVREELTWLPGSTKVSKEFWIDEAVAAYRVDNIGPCPCRKEEASPAISRLE
jgi:hypothetical protein